MRLLQKPQLFDFIVLSCFTILITLQPFYLHGEIEIYEIGLYLPGIEALFDQLVPYRDFFHLRGPFELYFPAFFMWLFGKQIAVLSTYFYFGSVFTLFIWVLIGRQLYSTRFIFYLMVPVLIARTFPRVVFTYWGGFRFALGALGLLFAIKYFKSEKIKWIFIAGVFSSLALFTSIEVGVCSFVGIGGALIFSYFFHIHPRRKIIKAVLFYILGNLMILLPYGGYLFLQDALFPFIESVYAVLVNMQKVINPQLMGPTPRNLIEVLMAMTDPFHKNFRHLTPLYFYIVLLVYLVFCIKQKHLKADQVCFVLIGIYGLTMYCAAFRAIGGSQFEMALQPEKVLMFFFLEKILLQLKNSRQTSVINKSPPLHPPWAITGLIHLVKKYAFFILFVIVFMSSFCYFIHRYDHRFFSFKWAKNSLLGKNTAYLNPLYRKSAVKLDLRRVKGLTVPAWQAEEIKQLKTFIQHTTEKNEKIFMFPELGAYYFIIDRPFAGRFPMATFSWFLQGWHEELLSDLMEQRPRLAIIAKDPGPSFPQIFFKVKKNREMFEEMMSYIHTRYKPITQTHTLLIYQRIQ